MEWVGDHIELVVGAIIGLLGIGVAIGIALHQNKPKRLDYQVRTSVRILAHDARPVSPLVKVSLAGMELQDPRLVVIRIKNTGKVSVVQEDYESPIIISYESNDPIAMMIARESSPGIASGILEADALIPFGGGFQPKLMNKGEWFDLQFISDGSPGKVTVTSRFKDQARPMRPIAPLESSPLRLMGVGAGLAAAAIGASSAAAADVQTSNTNRLITLAVGAIVTVLVLGILVVLDRLIVRSSNHDD